jgi:DNA excision repair protein ERCC-4
MDASAPEGSRGRAMMEKKLRLYLWWKGKLSTRKLEGKGPFGLPDKSGDALNTGGYQKQKGLRDGDGDGVSEALKKKDQVMKERGASRRRVRGGAPAGGGGGKKEQKDIIGEGEMRDEAERVANL